MVSTSGSLGALVTPFLALLLALSVTGITVIVVLLPINLTSSGLFSTAQRAIYVTGVTVIATIVTGFITSEIQALLSRKFDHDLYRWNSQSDDSSEANSRLNRRWRSILKINHFSENFYNTRLWAAYALVSLITTAIVASLTPNASTRRITYNQKVFNGWQQTCTEIYSLAKAQQDGVEYYWDLKNGSAYVNQANWGGCPTRDAMLYLGSLNTVDSDLFAYSDVGVAVHRSAIGAPLTIYSPEKYLAPEFYGLLTKFGSSVVKTTQCVRVMIKNPISCRPGGKMSISSTWFNVSSDDGHCSITHYTPDRNPLERQLTVKAMCPYGDVGQAGMVMAAVNQYAHWLAVAINDKAHAPDASLASSRYALSCTVDTRSVFEYRMVILELQNSNSTGSRFARILKSTGEPCSGPKLDRSLFGITAAANWQTLHQNDGLDGWPDSLWEATGIGRDPPYAFNNSKNALEDALGLVAALVGSRFNSTLTSAANGTATIANTKIGSGQLPALLYIIPSTFAAILIFYLIITVASLGSKAAYSSTELHGLIGFGRSQGPYPQQFRNQPGFMSYPQRNKV